MLLEIDFAKKKKKPAPALAVVTPIHGHGGQGKPHNKKKYNEHLTISI